MIKCCSGNPVITKSLESVVTGLSHLKCHFRFYTLYLMNSTTNSIIIIVVVLSGYLGITGVATQYTHARLQTICFVLML